MRKVVLAAAFATACSTSVPPSNPYDAQNPGARAPVAVTVALAADDPGALPGFVSCAPASTTPCRVNVRISSDGTPSEAQLSPDGAFAGATWAALPPGPSPWTLPLDLPAGADGPVTVHVRLRTVAGNVSAAFQATIERRSAPPSSPSLSFPSLVADAGAYYTNVLPLPLALSAVGADRMRVSCDAAQPLAVQPWIPYAPGMTCVLVAGDGDRTLSAVFMDEAGNVSSIATASVRLQQTPPPPPALTISVASGTDPGSRTLLTSATTARTTSLQFAVAVDASAAGQLLSHLDASSSAFLPVTVTPTLAKFTLAGGDVVSNATNLLTVRAVDKAGNVSAPATVSVVQERSGGPVAPTGLSLFTRPRSIEVTWSASASRFTTGYQLSYGPTSGYGGAGADQGVSPIPVGIPCDTSGTCRYVLTGLSNFQPQWLAVTPASELQAGSSATGGPVTPQPAGFSVLGSLSTAARNVALTVADDRAYVVQLDGLQIVDLSNPASPTALGKCAFDASIPSGGSSSIALRWPLAYVAGVDGMYVFDVSNEAMPSPACRKGKYLSTHPALANASRPVVALALRWPRAYLHVAGRYSDVGAILDVVDVTNPAAPTRVNWAQVPSYGDYLGPGWPYQGAVTVVGSTVTFGTVTNSPLTAWNVAGVTGAVAPALLSSTYFAGAAYHLAAELGPRRLVYVMENGSPSGIFRVFDFTNPAAPIAAGTAPGMPSGEFFVAGGDVYLASGSLLEVLNLTDLANPRIAGSLALPGQVGYAAAVAVSGTLAVVAGSSGLAVVQTAHLRYPEARGQAPSLGGLTGGGRVHLAGRIAVVPGNGISLYDVGDPTAPRVVANNYGSFGTGSDFSLGYGYSGGAALAGDLLFSAYGTASNSGTGLMAWSLGAPYQAIAGSPAPFPCGIARTVLDSNPSGPGARYYGVAARGGWVFATRGGTLGSALDSYSIDSYAGYTACAYGGGPYAAGPGRYGFSLLADPRDVQVHRRWAFVAETDGFEIIDVADPTAPVRKVRQAGLSGVSAVSARLGRCGGTACYHVSLATTGGIRVFTWLENAASVTDAGTLSTLGGASAVHAAHGLLVQGRDASGGLGFFDATAAPGAFQSYSTPVPSGSVYAIGAGGRFVYANDGGSFVIQELQ